MGLFSSLVGRKCLSLKFLPPSAVRCNKWQISPFRTGLPKGVLANQLASIIASFQGIIQNIRDVLRRGETFDFATPPPVQKAFLLVVPLFHVTGCQAIALGQTTVGGKIVMMRKWDVQKAVEIILKEKITSAGGCVYPSNHSYLERKKTFSLSPQRS